MARLFAIVQERENKIFVKDVPETEIAELGEFGLELMVSDWCEAHHYTYMDHTL